ncbi:MAG: ABC transporter permease [Thermoproteota archaeon]
MSEQYYRKLLRKSKLSMKDYAFILLIFVRRSAREWSFFKTSFLFNIIGIITGVLSYYFVKIMLNPSEIVSDLTPYGGDFMAFLIVGIAFQQYIDVALHGYYEGLANAYWSSTLEQYLTSPLNPLVFCVASVIWSFIIRSLNFILYLSLGVVFFKIRILFTNIVPVLLIFFISTIAVSGLGLLSASTFTLINAKGWEDPIRWAITTIEGLVVGTYYTPKVLPTFLQVLGLMLPQTYALDALRRLLILGSTSEKVLFAQFFVPIDPVVNDIIALFVTSVIYVPLGYYMFNKGIIFAKKAGNLSRWV